ALLNRPIDIKNVIGRATANIDHERAEVFLMLSEHNLRGSKRAEDNILDLERELLNAADGVLDPGADAVDNMKIGFQFLPEHADRIEHTILSIDMVMLDDGMKKRVRRGNAHLARAHLHILDVLLVDLLPTLRHDHAAAIVAALTVRA